MEKSLVYYTDNRLEESIFSAVQKQLLSVGLPIVSVSLKPIDFGQNITLDLPPGIITMYKQILAGLEASRAEIVFLCEHDVLYHPSHFDFIPKERKFYYNTNVWWWDYPKDRAVTYDFIRSQSGLCAFRELLLDHYRKRLKLIEERGWGQDSREPGWARRIGYEPATKSKRQEMISYEGSENRKSEYPNIDIRHKGALTPTKCDLNGFKHAPINWIETNLDKIEGWDLKKIFN